MRKWNTGLKAAAVLVSAALFLSLTAFSPAGSRTFQETTVQDSRLELIEGSNQVVFADTEEQKAAYVPQTGWRQAERSAPAERCRLSLVSVGGALREEDAAAFLAGERDSLSLAPGDSFLAELDGAHWLDEASLVLEGGAALELKITDVNQQKKLYFARLTASETIGFDPLQLCAYVQVKCPEGEELPAELRGLWLSGIPTLYEQILREDPEDPAVLDGTDPDNPLHVYRTPLRRSVCRLAERLLEGTEDLTAHQKMLVFIDFISDWYVGTDSGSHYLSLESYIEACGGYSNVLAALAASQGYPARVINLHNYPENYGHTVCEVFYDGAWHLYDPTYGAYYADKQADDPIMPSVLSFRALSGGLGNRGEVVCIVLNPQRLSSDAAYGFLGPRIYEEADPKGPIGPEYPMTYPLQLSLSEGIVERADFGIDYQGAHYLGAANTNVSQRWTLTGLTAGRSYEFTAVAGWLGGEVPGPFTAWYVLYENGRIRQIETHVFDANDPASLTWTIRFEAKGDSEQLLLKHPCRGPEFRYVSFSSFELKEIT